MPHTYNQLCIDLGAFDYNLRAIRDKVGKERKVMLVVKADGYGHGGVEIARRAQERGVEMLAVASVAEGVNLREAGIQLPLLLLFSPFEEEVEEALLHDLIFSVASLKFARTLSKIAARLKRRSEVHLSVDTGMGRYGFFPHETPQALYHMAQMESLSLIGLFTHLSSAQRAHDSFTLRQLSLFSSLMRELKEKGLTTPLLLHSANSAGVLNYPASYMNMVRPGLLAYGLLPDESLAHKISLKPCLSLKSRVAFLKTFPPGKPVGYEQTYVTTKSPSLIATLPIGYGHGLSRGLSNKGFVLIRGKRAPMVGTVCMDQTMVDVSHIPGVKEGDEAVLIGRQGDQSITVEEVARTLGTIPYEVVCRLGTSLERHYLNAEIEETNGQKAGDSDHP